MRDKILIVDDSKFNREVLKNILDDDYQIIEAENGQEALDMVEKHMQEIAAIFLDIVMPIMDGVTFLKKMTDKKYLGRFPVLVVTSEQSVESVAECFEYGAADYIRKPVNTDFVKQRLDKLLDLYVQKNEFQEKVEHQTVTLRTQYHVLQKQAAQLKKTNENIIEMLGTVVEYRNLEGRRHTARVREFTRILGTHVMEGYPEYELDEEKVSAIAMASVLHDVGKVMISDEILLKPAKLTEEEFEYVKSHSLRGYEIVSSMADLWAGEHMEYTKDIVRYHHEKYDGSGYPDGLKGDEIPISAQLVSLADCYESLISESVYKDAIPYEDAFNMILQGECGVFSYKLLECFRKAKQELEAFAESTESKEE
ncbi:MAG: response regulator [Lachnospiraceae bacterium]|nr:response regulator [Lachnospiraceae bacterium]